MYFTKAILAALSLNLLLVAAAPAANVVAKRSSTPMSKRATASVLMCTDPKSEGDCQTQEIPLETCTRLSNGYAGNVGAIQNLSSKSAKCTWFLTTDCTGSSYDNQDDQNLRDGNGDFAAMEAASCK